MSTAMMSLWHQRLTVLKQGLELRQLLVKMMSS